MIYYALLFLFNILFVQSVYCSQDLEEGKITRLSYKTHYEIANYCSLSSLGAMQQTCASFKKCYSFENVKDYGLCSHLILKLVHSDNKKNQQKALKFLELNNYDKRKQSLELLYGTSEAITIDYLRSPFNFIDYKTDGNVLQTMFDKIYNDEFAALTVCYNNLDREVDNQGNMLIHCLVKNSNFVHMFEYLTKYQLINTEILNVINFKEETPFHFLVCSNNSQKIITALIANNLVTQAMLNHTDKNGYNAFDWLRLIQYFKGTDS